MNKVKVPKEVLKICSVLDSHGYKAWLAGGCVRDSILGIKPKDFDIATDATPEQVEGLFEKTVSVGKSFGVIRVVTAGSDIEVATFRKDGDYKDGRHPENVEFSKPEEDAKRRDFTINALFYDVLKKESHDYVGGLQDIKGKTIRTVGDSDQRFSEDKLRILRAIRFVSQLGFNIEEVTLKAIQKNASHIHQVSGERLFEELNKLMGGKYFLKSMGYMKSSGLLSQIFETSKLKFSHKISKKAFPRWIIIFQQIKKRDILWSRLKTSREFRNQVEETLEILNKLKKFNKLNLAERKRLAASQNMQFAIELDSKHKAFIQKNKKLPRPLVDSKLLFSLGFKPGEEFGKLLSDSFDAQLMGKIKNKKQALSFLGKKK